MRKFFRLVDDVRITDRWHLGEILENNASLELWNGKPIGNGKLLKVTIDRTGRPLDFSLTSFAVPVARTTLVNAIVLIAGADLERLSVVIDNYKEFEVLNSLRIIACLDENKSEFTKWTQKDHRPELAGQYRMVTKLRIDPTRIPLDAHFFRIEGWKIGLIVSQEIKNAMEAVGCLGAVFYDVV